MKLVSSKTVIKSLLSASILTSSICLAHEVLHEQPIVDQTTTHTQEHIMSEHSLKVVGAYTRPAAKGANSAVYAKLQNTSANHIIIKSAKCSAAEVTEMHESFTDEANISKMIAVDQLLIPANSAIELKPGGAHVMLLNLKDSLKVGDDIVVTLVLESGQELAFHATVSVEK